MSKKFHRRLKKIIYKMVQTKCKECSTQANFNISGQPPRYCALHKKENMVNVCCKQCKKCDVRASFAYEGQPAKYCGSHKKENMINVVCKSCLKCDVRANYGEKNTKNALYCFKHKKENMVDVRHTTCLDCLTRATFGQPGTKKPIYCVNHKLEGMVDICSKKCKECDTVANFGVSSTKTVTHCALHKLEGMVDLRHKKCLDCSTQAVFGSPGTTTVIYCAKHKKDGMIMLRADYCQNCDTLANFAERGSKKGLYCSKHKLPGMVDIKNKSCKNEWCDTLITKKYEGYCCFCFSNMFPDHELTRSYKTKEKTVAEFVKNEFPDIDFICDKTIYNGCSKKRPDMFVDFGDWVLIIEVDENEHNGYSCENKRIMQLSQDIDHRPMRIIRFNPDKYTRDDIKVASCWRNTIKGTFLVKTKMKDWNDRLEYLKHKIQKSINNPTTKTISITNLFYSN